MSHVFSFCVDDETAARVFNDIKALSEAIGEGRDLSVSQYFRLIIDQRLHGGERSPYETGWGEGFRSGAADNRRAYETFMADWVRRHRDDTEAIEAAAHAGTLHPIDR